MLVEGRNDQYVLRGLLRHHGIVCTIPGREDRKSGSDDIVIDQKENVQGVLEALEVILDDGDLEKLAIIVDADENVAARWDALRNVFVRFGQRDDVPRNPSSEGTVFALNQRYRTLDVGVWLMPNNQVPGILENFVSFLIPNEHEVLWQYAVECVNQIPEKPLFRNVDLPKAQIHTWLAWQEEPGQPLGIAITAKYLNADAPYASTLINWVRRVFGLVA